MEKKGYLRYEEGGKRGEYYPAVLRSEVVLAETEAFSVVYIRVVSVCWSALVDQHSLSEQEIKELRTILDKTEGER